MTRNSWPSYRILILAGSRSEKTNALLNQINHEPDIDKIYLYTKDTYKAKYQLLICKSILMIQKLLLKNKKTIQKKWKILIVFDDLINDMLSSKKLNPIVAELFIRGRELNISLVLIT